MGLLIAGLATAVLVVAIIVFMKARDAHKVKVILARVKAEEDRKDAIIAKDLAEAAAAVAEAEPKLKLRKPKAKKEK